MSPHLHAYRHLHLHISIPTRLPVSTPARLHTSTPPCLHVGILYTRLQASTPPGLQAYIPARLHAYIHLHVSIPPCLYTSMRTRLYTFVLSCHAWAYTPTEVWICPRARCRGISQRRYVTYSYQIHRKYHFSNTLDVCRCICVTNVCPPACHRPPAHNPPLPPARH